MKGGGFCARDFSEGATRGKRGLGGGGGGGGLEGGSPTRANRTRRGGFVGSWVLTAQGLLRTNKALIQITHLKTRSGPTRHSFKSHI